MGRTTYPSHSACLYTCGAVRGLHPLASSAGTCVRPK